jgi:taurine dioxygenase
MCALEIPAAGTTTSFANGVLAWRDLPPSLRARATGALAWHALGAFELGAEGARTRGNVLSSAAPRTAHRLPFVHPRTGAEVLYVTDLHVERLEGVDEGDALLDALLAHLYAPEHVYVHHWQVGDLLVWDNLALQHARPDVSTVGARTFRRNSLNTHRWIELVGAPPG